MSAAQVHPLAGKPAPGSLLINIAKLVTAYNTDQPIPGEAASGGQADSAVWPASSPTRRVTEEFRWSA